MSGLKIIKAQISHLPAIGGIDTFRKVQAFSTYTDTLAKFRRLESSDCINGYFKAEKYHDDLMEKIQNEGKDRAIVEAVSHAWITFRYHTNESNVIGNASKWLKVFLKRDYSYLRNS